jgi:hypothetical protein
MKKQCLPTCLIIRNICLALLLIASSVVLTAEIHASANQQQEKTEALRRMFVYQLMVNAEQD